MSFELTKEFLELLNSAIQKKDTLWMKKNLFVLHHADIAAIINELEFEQYNLKDSNLEIRFLISIACALNGVTTPISLHDKDFFKFNSLSITKIISSSLIQDLLSGGFWQSPLWLINSIPPSLSCSVFTLKILS